MRFGAAVMALTCLVAAPTVAQDLDEPFRVQAFMRQVNRKYELISPVPRRAVMQVAATVSMLGARDRRVRGTATVTQWGRFARCDMDTVLIQQSDGDSLDGERAVPGGHLSWVSDGDTLRVKYIQPPSDPPLPEREFWVDLRKLPESMARRFREPMAEPELASVYLQTPFTLATRVVDARPLEVLRSQTEVAFSPGSRAFVTLWVDAESMLIVRAAYEGSFQGGQKTAAYWYSTSIDISYQFQVPIPDGIFGLTLRPDAEDATAFIAEEGRAALGLLP